MTPETIVFGRFEKASCSVAGNARNNSLFDDFLGSSEVHSSKWCFSLYGRRRLLL